MDKSLPDGEKPGADDDCRESGHEKRAEKKEKKILLVDDDEDDFIITRDLLMEIRDVDFRIEWVSSYEDAREALKKATHDICLLDYRLGKHTGIELLREATEHGLNLPVILLTGQGDKNIDLEAMKSGACDYLVKDQINSTLLERSIRYSIERKRDEIEKIKLINELKKALDEVKTLSGMLPICASCKKIRDDSGYWNQVEEYIEEHTDVEFSHGICPECSKRLYPMLEQNDE